MREVCLTIIGFIGSALSYFLGGVDTMFIIMCVFLAVDYISGVIVAMVFKNSTKTENGKVNSTVSFKGLLKKFYMVCLVGVAHLLDIALGVNFIRAGVITAFVANETISIIENAGLMGIPIPKVLQNALEVLNEREDNINE